MMRNDHECFLVRAGRHNAVVAHVARIPGGLKLLRVSQDAGLLPLLPPGLTSRAFESRAAIRRALVTLMREAADGNR